MSFFSNEINRLKELNLYRLPRLVESAMGSKVTVDGKETLLFCSNNYLGLADHPEVVNASVDAVKKYGCGSGASRLVSGNMTLHEELERQIAGLKDREAALIFNSGYAANCGILQAVAGRDDIIFSDRINHASIVDGATLSRARLIRYPHCDHAALAKLLESSKSIGRKIIVTDTVFSMDGDIAPLAELAELAERFDAIMITDDAHGTGVLGKHGRGTVDLYGISEKIDIQMGTLGKGLGTFGAYVTGSQDCIDYLRNRARSFIFSTSLPPASLAASIKALQISASDEGDQLRLCLENNSRLMSSMLVEAGFNTLGSKTQIIPIIVGDAGKTMEFSRMLFAEGLFIQGIRPPTVPAGASRLRITLMATHSKSDIGYAAEKIISIGKKLGVI